MIKRTQDLDSVLEEVSERYPVRKGQIALQGLFIDIAIAITKMRKSKGVSQRELARRLFTAQSTVARWETPGYSSYTLTKLSEIAESLDFALQMAFVEKKGINTKTVQCGVWQVDDQVNDRKIMPAPYVPHVKDWSPSSVRIANYITQEVIA